MGCGLAAARPFPPSKMPPSPALARAPTTLRRRKSCSLTKWPLPQASDGQWGRKGGVSRRVDVGVLPDSFSILLPPVLSESPGPSPVSVPGVWGAGGL